MKIRVFARVGCTFNLDCEPNEESILKALQEQLKTIPYINGETYIPEDENCITDFNGNPIYDLSEREEWELDTSFEPTYFLFGNDACYIYQQEGIEALIEYIESNSGYQLYEYTGNVFDFASNFEGWDQYIRLNKEEYEQLSNL